MKVAVRYYTKTGNTKRLAEAVAEAVGAEALPLNVPIEEPVDVLFLGNSFYAFTIDPEVREFIRRLDKEKVGRIVNFGSAAMMNSTWKKVKAEAKRLEQEEKVRKLFEDTAKKCGEALGVLDKTRVGKSGSSSYEKFHKMLEEGSKIGAGTSVSEMSDFLSRFTEASENYRNSHDSLIGPVTEDGGIRLAKSKEMKALGKDTAEELKKLSKGLGEKNVPIGFRIMNSGARLKALQNKQAELEGAAKQPEAKPGQPAQPVIAR
ncbi:MAG: hypothetical protein IJM17_00290 [Firmicutes bacterium]|nr:hypothetical protein [Bacillota bacterium]